MKALWRGYITLGQLGIPVRLYSATQSIRPHFVYLHEKDSSPVTRNLKCEKEDKEIPFGETIRAVEAEPGRFIAFTEQELERASGQEVKTFDVKQFCEPKAIDTVYFEKPYFITPTKGGERAYALLREVLARTDKLAVVQGIIYGNEHIAAIGVRGDLLLLNQLRFEAELTPRSNLKTPPLPKPHPNEIEALEAVVERFSGSFYIEDYHDEYSECVRELVERKAKGLPDSSRRERPDAHATPEDEIVNALASTLNNQPHLDSGEG